MPNLPSHAATNRRPITRSSLKRRAASAVGALIAVMLAIALAGCNTVATPSRTSSTQTPLPKASARPTGVVVQPSPAQMSAERAAAIEAAISSADLTNTDSNGYAFDKTVRVSGWIKGSDTATLNAVWSYFGKDGSYPLAKDTDLILIGTLSLRYTTEGFPLSSAQPYNGDAATTQLMLAVGDSGAFREPTLTVFPSKGPESDGTRQIRPRMVGPKWGPVVFTLILEDAITPNNPDGPPEIHDASLLFNSICLSTVSCRQKGAEIPLSTMGKLAEG